jgi:hypothetical protein
MGFGFVPIIIVSLPIDFIVSPKNLQAHFQVKSKSLSPAGAEREAGTYPAAPEKSYIYWSFL